MRLFHAPECFDTRHAGTGTLSQLLENIQPFRKLRCDHSQAVDDLKTAFCSNCSAARAASLLYMRQLDESEFFEPPPLKDLFKDVTKIPEKIIEHVSPKFAAWWSSEHLSMLTNHQKLASLIIKLFEHEITLSFVFAYSTFPSLFGFFQVREMIPLGAGLIENIIKQDTKGKMDMVVMSMTASFVLCMHQFFDVLWSEFAVKVAALPNITNDECWDILYEVFQSRACLLTQYHITTIGLMLCQNHTDGCNLLFRDILAPSLRIRFGNWMNDFATYLETCTTQKETEGKRNHFMVMVTSHRSYIDTLPACPAFEWVKQLRFVMADVDIRIIQEIFKMNTNPSYAAKVVMSCEVGDDKYTPFYVELPFVRPKERKNKTALLAGEMLCHKADMEMLNRVTVRFGVDILSCLSGTSFERAGIPFVVPNCCRNREFQEFVMAEELKQAKESEKRWKTLTKIVNRTHEFESTHAWIERVNASLLEKLAETHVKKKRIISYKKIRHDDVINILKRELEESEREMRLYILTSILDRFGPVKLSLPKLTTAFCGLADTFVKKAAEQWESCYPQIATRLRQRTQVIKSILKTCEGSRNLGTRFRLILHLVEQLDKADRRLMTQTNGDSQFQGMFEFCLYEVHTNWEVLCIGMLLLQRFIGNNTEIKNLLSDDQREMCSRVFAAFQNLLAYDYNVYALFTAHVDVKLTNVIFCPQKLR